MAETNKKFNLAGAIEYQTGSVVSKTIIKKNVGTITIFAFDQGEALSAHSAPFDAYLQVVDGKSEITVGEDVHILNAGEFIILPANISHAVKALEKFKMLLVMIKS